ncbi:MAG: zf-HC2 domain-containing protein [Anaerolineae bacterium]|nr:zf-HC2 domain-containing protein [Anaerolineae bacterium]
MSEHVQRELEAYYDGQLHGTQQKRVATHLETCAECCAELTRLERLSALLQEAPVPAARLAPERFTTQVRLQLQPRDVPERRRHHWAIPALLVGAWSFMEAVWLVSRGLMVALALGLGERPEMAWFNPNRGTSLWQLLQGMESGWQGALSLFSFLSSTLLSTLLPLVLLGSISILFWGWWLAWRPHEIKNGNR